MDGDGAKNYTVEGSIVGFRNGVVVAGSGGGGGGGGRG